MAKKAISQSDMWAVWNPDIGFYVDTRLSRQEMIDKHTSDLGMTWDECKKVGDKVIRVVITAAQQRLHLTAATPRKTSAKSKAVKAVKSRRK